MNGVVSVAHYLVVWSWQSLILLCITWLLLRLDRSHSPALRSRLWLLGLIAIASLPVWTSLVRVMPVPQPVFLRLTDLVTVETNSPPGPVQADEMGIPSTPIRPAAYEVGWLLVFVGWLAGLSISGVQTWRSFRKVRQLRRGGTPIQWPESFQPSPRVGLLSSNEIAGPMLAGIRRPVILVPAGLEQWTTPEERAAILRHELAHLIRRDHIANAFQAVLRCAFFFHPMVRYASNQVNTERELACDRFVVESGYGAEMYADVVLKVAEHDVARRQRLQTTFSSSRKILERRITMIFERQPMTASLRKRSSMTMVCSVVVLALIMWGLMPQRVLTAERPIAETSLLKEIVEAAEPATPVARPSSPRANIVPRAIRQAPEFQSRVARPLDPQDNEESFRAYLAQLAARGTPQQAQVFSSLSGSVLDPTGALVPGARIDVKDSADNVTLTTVSDEQGRWQLPILQPGQYRIEASMAGFQKQAVNATVKVGESLSLNFNLRVGVIAQQMEVVAKSAAPGTSPTKPQPERKRIGGIVSQASLVFKPALNYPVALRAAGIQGDVTLECVIDRDGKVSAIRSVGGGGAPELEAAAIENVQQWRYKPTTLNNEPVESLATITLSFRIQD